MTMKLHHILLLVLCLLLNLSVKSQVCGDVVLDTQTQLNNFVNFNSDCAIIDGNLEIGNNVTDLSGLSFLKEVTGTLRISPSGFGSLHLETLNGLHNLEKCGKVFINESAFLTSLEGLHNLKECGDIYINDCETLTSIGALSNIVPNTYSELKISELPMINCDDPSLCIVFGLFDKVDWRTSNGCSYAEAIEQSCVDNDADGYSNFVDCDDSNPTIYPGAEEFLNNGIDENCDGFLENDSDGDGYSNLEECHDNNPLIFPGADEILYNGIDEDCDGYDEGCTSYTANYPSQDISKHQRRPIVRLDSERFIFYTNQGQQSTLIMLDNNGYATWTKQLETAIINLRSDGKEIFLHSKEGNTYYITILDLNGNQILKSQSSAIFLSDKYGISEIEECFTIGGSLNHNAKTNIFNTENNTNVRRINIIPGGFKLHDGHYLYYSASPKTCFELPYEILKTTSAGSIYVGFGNDSIPFDYHLNPLLINNKLIHVPFYESNGNNVVTKDYFIVGWGGYIYDGNSFFRDELESFAENTIDAFIYDNEKISLGQGNKLLIQPSSLTFTYLIDLPYTNVISFTMVTKNKLLLLDKVSDDEIVVRRMYIENGQICENTLNTIDTTNCADILIDNELISESGVYYSESENTVYNYQKADNIFLYEELYFCEGTTTMFRDEEIDQPGQYEFSASGEFCDTIWQVEAIRIDNPVIDTTVNINCLINNMFEGVEIIAPGTYNMTVPNSSACGKRIEATITEENIIIYEPIIVPICINEFEVAYRDTTYFFNFNDPNLIKTYYTNNPDGCDTTYKNIQLEFLTIIEENLSYDLGEMVVSELGIFDSFVFEGDISFTASDCNEFTYLYNIYTNYNNWTIPLDELDKFSINDNNTIIVSTYDEECLGYLENELVWQKKIENKIDINTYKVTDIKINTGLSYYLGDDLKIYSIDFPDGEIIDEGIDLNSFFIDTLGTIEYTDWDIYFNGETTKSIAVHVTDGINQGQKLTWLNYKINDTEGATTIYNNFFDTGAYILRAFDNDGYYRYMTNFTEFLINFEGISFDSYSEPINPVIIEYNEEYGAFCVNNWLLSCSFYTDPPLFSNWSTSNVENAAFIEIHDSIIFIDHSLMFNLADGTYLGKLDPERLDVIEHIEFTNNNKAILQGEQSGHRFIIKDDWNPEFFENLTVIYGDQFKGITITKDTTLIVTEPFNLGELNKTYIVSVMLVDEDQDGFTNDVDCNDNNPNINPDAIEIPDNGIDEDCDGIGGTITSLYDIDFNTPLLYPNPTTGAIYLQPKNSSNYDLELLDINGKILGSWNGLKGKFLIDLNDKPNGIYYINYTSKNHNTLPYILKTVKI